MGQILVLEEYALVMGDGRVAAMASGSPSPGDETGDFEGTVVASWSHPWPAGGVGNMHFLLVSSVVRTCSR